MFDIQVVIISFIKQSIFYLDSTSLGTFVEVCNRIKIRSSIIIDSNVTNVKNLELELPI